MLSWVQGVGKPLLSWSVGEWIRESAVKWPNNTAITCSHQGISYTYEELLARSEKFAEGLTALGLQKGARVGLYSQNNVEWLVTWFACSMADLVLVNINPAYRADELEFWMNNVDMEAIITAESFKTSDYLQIIESLCPELPKSAPGKIESKIVPSLKHVIVMSDKEYKGCYKFDDIYKLNNSDEYANRTSLVDYRSACNIQFTSGTTGNPKGATLNHLGIVNNANIFADLTRMVPEDVLCIPVPMYHAFGMIMGVLTGYLRGAKVVFPSWGFEADAALRAMSEENCTSVYGTPTTLNDMCREQDIHNLPLTHARKGVVAGSVTPPDLVRTCQDKLNIKDLQIAYGMTELSPACMVTPIGCDREKQLHTVGQIFPSTEARIVETTWDADSAQNVVEDNPRTMPLGQPGELWIRGYLLMEGYWNDPEKTLKTMAPGGWIRTGDLGWIDEDGYCRITGRLKDTIIRGGENCYPTEIEEVLRQHPDVHDAQVIGQPDHRLGEKIRAVFIMKPEKEKLTHEEIKAFCKEKMAHYKIPEFIDFTDEYPSTASKKVQKNVLKKQFNFDI